MHAVKPEEAMSRPFTRPRRPPRRSVAAASDETGSRVVSDHNAAFVADHDVADPVAMLEYREHLVWETWIQIEMATVFRESLAAAARPRFVNQQLESTRSVSWGKEHLPPDLRAEEEISQLQFESDHVAV
ncbi:hypothetical protein QYE76_068690 [Lolium multiflorum]|uniref:Uncharacterized protein n=1 Tax=Lolium multiflorum TaxID=4521 RepID=A0AAD8WCU5_LOLMU|nr:hypothetical protein QYE76_068690 [Lolium multiflorum]